MIGGTNFEEAATNGSPNVSAIATPRRISVRGPSARAQRRHSRVVRIVLVAGGVVVLWMWWAGVPSTAAATPSALVTTFGELSGMIAAYLVCAQVLLIARIPWFERAVGLDKLVLWHRTLGTTVVLLVVTHVVAMIVGGELLDRSMPWSELISILQNYPDMLVALLGTIAFIAVGLSSARLLRARLSYEVWYWLHLTTYVAIFLTFLHQLSAGTHFVASPINRAVWLLLYLGTASAVLTWRFILPTANAWRHRMRVESVVRENAGTTSVWFTGPHLDELGVRAGNFLLFRFLSWGHLLTAHPYSVSRVPYDGRLRITVGALGNHSALVRELEPGTLVFVEGPFGHFTADRASRERILLIAGGAGIGPIRALAEELTARGLTPVLIYRAHSAGTLALLDELRALPGLTVIPVVGRRSELGYDPLSPGALGTIIRDLHNWEVFVCGPEGMMLTVEASLRELQVPKRFIHREELSMS
ncbi:ferredoxin reductase family protein [Diaminobutyricibacter tongyongensis]|uniref:Ferredoxin reductase family protein n=1 Tax=Leifsonia tongyongensis TaxID=1268043 RepID=A0A6L9XVR0_9MICO|nr:ferredoxin reductase family protein [Diaminobutyricibacter tongyongensis]NEN05114.1 ferredoxin reductase family protein [Diaminobutyricibacter tongyongensis]